MNSREPAPTPRAPTRAPTVLDLRGDDATEALARLRSDLSGAAPAIAPKYFYDPLGARLFEAITLLPEYYLTRAEAALLARHRDAIAAHILASTGAAAGQATLIDLGAGNCEKASGWIGALRAGHYTAVDIAVDGLEPALARLQQRHPDVDLLGIGCDFSRQLRLPHQQGTPVALYPGSSIGNFSPAEAHDFLQQVCAACPGGGLLIGVDLVKPRQILEAAYDDSLGITAAFNRNVLLHVNRLIGADFALGDWSHGALYDPHHGRIEMHLEARRDVTVTWQGGGRHFDQGTRIHTENSYKWDIAAFEQLLLGAGFHGLRHWTDPQEGFAVFWAMG